MIKLRIARDGVKIISTLPESDARLIGKKEIESRNYPLNQFRPELFRDHRIGGLPEFEMDGSCIRSVSIPFEQIEIKSMDKDIHSSIEDHLMRTKGEIKDWRKGFIAGLSKPEHMIYKVKTFIKEKGDVSWADLSRHLADIGYKNPRTSGEVAECLFLLKELSYIMVEGRGPSRSFKWIAKS